MSRIKVDSITDRNNSSAPILIHGATVPNGQLNVNGNANLTGISTILGSIVASNASVSGVVSSGFFVGDGSGLFAVPSVSTSKSIALKIILDPLPFRS
jgi:hypothetical protein